MSTTTTTQTVILGGHAYPAEVVQEAIKRVKVQRERKACPASCSRCGSQTWERFYFDGAPAKVLCRACATDNGRHRIRPPWSRLG
jgi:hypothetical protein